ncbi:hypothetical protein GF377_06665, partial [candidate division GN15 bacterium]|nr:hypothetical protein [candidate division GN15 bacterium]
MQPILSRSSFHLTLTVAVLACSLTCLFSDLGYGQQCGTRPADIQWEKQFERVVAGVTYPTIRPQAAGYRIPVAFHIIRRSDGTGPDGPCPGAPPDTLPHPGMFRLGQVDSALTDLNDMFLQVGWEFFLAEPVNYIDDDDLYCMSMTGVSIWTLTQTASVEGAVNIYAAPNTGQRGSTMYLPHAAGILVDASAAGVPENPSTLAHEMGHYFGLFHTHEIRWDGTDFVYECPDGSNCETAGDLICDTPADPDLLFYGTASCGYSGTAPPPSGCDNTPYDPLTDNLMSYASATCRSTFTEGQMAKMDHI